MLNKAIFERSKNLISIIIPSFNERYKILETLEALIEHLENSSLNMEYEIIVVDSSEDDTFQILEQSVYSKNDKCKFIHSEKRLFPGEARNIGVKNSKFDIIVFVDSGFTFEDNWITELVKPLIQHKDGEIDIVWGITKTNTKERKDRLIAYLVESKSSKRSILPNVALRKKIFYDGNWFLNDLRAVEDTRFIKQIIGKYNETFVNAINYYSGHPKTLRSAFKKWSDYSYYSVKAGYYKKTKLSLFQISVFILILILIVFPYSVILILLLQLFRILYKSNKNYKVSFLEIPYILILSFCIDFGRLYGSIKGLIGKLI